MVVILKVIIVDQDPALKKERSDLQQGDGRDENGPTPPVIRHERANARMMNGQIHRTGPAHFAKRAPAVAAGQRHVRLRSPNWYNAPHGPGLSPSPACGCCCVLRWI